MLRLAPALRDELHRLAAAGYPREVCGLLLGRSEGEIRTAVRVWPARNAWEDDPRARAALLAATSPGPTRAEWEAHGEDRRFLIAPEEILAAEREARAAGLATIGIYHTHPDHPARPSAFYRQIAFPDVSYLILSVRGGEVVEMRSWFLEDFEAPFQEEAVVLTDA